MARLIPFNKFEAALLLDAYLKTLSSDKPRMHFVKQASNDLRRMAINNGQSIDDIYRNVNGISLQMASMESAYQGYTIKKPATKLFMEITELYKRDNEKYMQLLKEAKAMVNGQKTMAEQYSLWLSNKVSPAQLAEIYLCYADIEAFCLKIKILKQPLFETTDLQTVKNVQKAVSENRIFQLQHKKQMKNIVSAAGFYVSFVKELNEKSSDENISSKPSMQEGTFTADKPLETQSETVASEVPVRNVADRILLEMYPILFKKVYTVLSQQDEPIVAEDIQSKIGMFSRITDIYTILMKASWAMECTDGKYLYVSESITHDTPVLSNTQVNFTDIKDIPYTKPTKVTYFEDDIGSVASWTDAYVKIVAVLYEDYPTVIPFNKSFNGDGRPDFGDKKTSEIMLAPKHVIEGYYLETNVSATNILKKIKTLLDICNVDYENLVIEYECKNPSPSATVTDSSIKQSSGALSSAPGEEDFYNYLRNVSNMADATCRSIVSAIRNVERYANKHGYSQTKIFGQTSETIRAISEELFRDKEFIEYNSQQHSRFRVALNKILASMDSTKPTGVTGGSVTPPQSYGDTSDYEKVLEEHFVKGFRLGSSLEMKKFKRYYAELNGEELTREDSEIENIIRSCGIVHEEKVFMPKMMLSDEIKNKLFQYIADSFKSGKSFIYYEALFKEFSEDFLDHYIYNAEMLKSYLAYVNDGSYYIDKNQITKEAGTTSDPIDEVRSCLKDHGGPMEVDRLCEILSHLPRNNVVTILRSNLEFVRNSRGEYFHADVMSLSEEELDNISEIIDDAVRSHNFISGTELLNAIKTKYPYTYEAYSSYSDIAWRDALKYKFGDRFSFKGNIISAPNATLSMSDVFGDLAANAERLSMDELVKFAEEMGTVIYFDAVYDNALRINEDLFVSKKQARFQVKETDAILDRFVTGKYLPLKEVSVFGIFPESGFPWNIYLLESYVAYYSEKYTLIHVGYNRNCAVGAIVKRSAGYQDLDGLVEDVLADSDIDLNKENVLEYLVQNGYIARRSYANIEGILIRAKAKRQTERRP